MKQKIALLAIVLGVTSIPVHAEFKDGNKLLAEMRGAAMEQMVALGYVTGVADALNGSSVCPPPNVTAGQMKDMVLQYLENFPRSRSFTGDTIIHLVLSTAWPSKKGAGV